VRGGGERSDESLAAAAREGSEEAFRELVERFATPVHNLIVRIVRRRELAEELSQESFVKAWRALGRFDPERKFSSWLFKIAHNTALDALRRGGPEPVSLDAPRAAGEPAPELPADPRAEDPLARALARDAHRALERAVAELRPAYREILLLRFVEGLAYEEIAEVTGAPLGTVKVHLFRARQELAKRLAAQGLEAGAGSRDRRNPGPGTA
jgi:RNA polymerase sigma-70 factor (ECF subfamily)